MQFIDLKSQYEHLRARIDLRIKNVLEHGSYIMGPEVMELEKQLTDYVGVKYCIACANGTDALQLLLMAENVGPGDAVFAPAFTFFATAEVIALAGATPIFVDIDPATFNLSPEKLRESIERVKVEGKLKPKAIIAVDLFGQPADYASIEIIAKEHELYLIEDGAQGFGGKINGRNACSFGDAATTSFFPAKPLGCYGDGGAIFTNCEERAAKLRSLRIHGQGVDKYDNVRIGLNSRLDTIQAAILLEKLAEFPIELQKRQVVAQYYTDNIDASLVLPVLSYGYSSSWAQYTLRAKDSIARSKYQDALKKAGIPSAIYYGKSLDKQLAFKYASSSFDLRVTHLVSDQVFSIPMHPYLTIEQLESVVQCINSVK